MRFEDCITALTIGPEQHKPPEVRWLSLTETFEQAESIPALAHSTPGVGVVQYELLIALCTATGVYPRTPGQWRDWVENRYPLEEVAQQLRERFEGLLDVCHREHPFGQNRLLAPYLAAHGYGPAQLVLERAAHGVQFTDHVHLHSGPMPMREAVQAMLVQNAYGLGGRMMAKTGWLGPNLTYGAVGRLAQRVRTLALGENLADTLRLNLEPTTVPGHFNFSWTLPPPGRPRRVFHGPRNAQRYRPTGPVDLHSVLGRSVLMSARRAPDGQVVTDRVLLGAGELLEPLGQAHLQDTPLRRGKPLTARPDRALWQQAHALYAAATPNNKESDLFSRLTRLDRPVRLWSVALVAEKATPLNWVSDTFPFHNGEQEHLLGAAADGAVWAEYLERAVRRAATVARDLVYPQARPEKRERERLLSRFHPGPQLWAGFEAPFHDLLDQLARGADTSQARAAFARSVVELARQCLNERLRSLPRGPLALQARACAQARLEEELTRRQTPPELKDAAMPPSPAPVPPAQPDSLPDEHSERNEHDGAPAAPAQRGREHMVLGHWLASLVRSHDQSALAALREGRGYHRGPLQEAMSYAPENDRAAYAATARLFARYHAALPWQEYVRLYGSGDLGRALGRVGSPGARGPKDPGCKRLFDRITAPGPLPLTDLAHAVDRLRAADRFPPNWAQLALDLAAWSDPDEATQNSWARSFYTPASRTRQGAPA
ncbi:type I-E CRISPR-associated protein Cse1/CasA [Streptomyces noboritoensis]|uniref:Type I-E CRISPR-associated protein Cse1/CasA n=1 Tax=Streptomyces noboritoensis TaxID=67337 RepID=A0ABV6TE86_9ACTN